MTKLITLLAIMFSLNSFAKLDLGKTIPQVTLKGDDGGKVDNTQWSSSDMMGKVNVIFYVDPDEKNTNNHTSEALKKENIDRTYYGSNAIINMDATWLPNVAIASSLKKKQEEYPKTVYVKDLKKVLVKKWKMQDDASNIVLIDPKGNVLFHEHGALSKDNVAKLIKMIHTEIAKLKK